MGMRPLDESAWLEVDDQYEAELALKASLLKANYGVVVATSPQGDEGSRELLDDVVEFLSRYHPPC